MPRALPTIVAVLAALVVPSCGSSEPVAASPPVPPPPASPPPSTPLPPPVRPVQPEDPRIAGARARAAAGNEAEAATALRALIDARDTGPDANRTRAQARLAMVELWLAHETAHPAPAPCLPRLPPGSASAPPRATLVAIPDLLAARSAARVELSCAEREGRDVTAARARIDEAVRVEAASCRDRGMEPMEGRLEVLFTGAPPPDPCAPASLDQGGRSRPPSIDQRLGVRPTGSDHGDSLRDLTLPGVGTDPGPSRRRGQH